MLSAAGTRAFHRPEAQRLGRAMTAMRLPTGGISNYSPQTAMFWRSVDIHVGSFSIKIEILGSWT
jgi:hypothetical protein